MDPHHTVNAHGMVGTDRDKAWRESSIYGWEVPAFLLPNEIEQGGTDWVHVWTDGSAHAGEGGWAFVADWNERRWEACGYMEHSTVAISELEAVMQALRQIHISPQPLVVHIDSTWVMHGLVRYGPDSLRAGRWIGGPEVDPGYIALLCQAMTLLDCHFARRRIGFKHVKGHANHYQNERADALAGWARRAKFGMPLEEVPCVKL